jgi:phthalate 4,5-dioxygenase oxygenase subunit
VEVGGDPPMVLTAEQAQALEGPDTMDCIAPADDWQAFWQRAASAKRQNADWLVAAARAGDTEAMPAGSDALPARVPGDPASVTVPAP